MSEFNELIKNFDKVRNYIRDFYIYGFMVRSEYKHKSSRTYDNERRRIESWLIDFISWHHTERGKLVSISLNSRKVSSNPLYSAWKSKSFTDNDIMLHFYLIDILYNNKLSANEIVDEINQKYNILFDIQTVRNKANEYVANGIFIFEKCGRKLLYSFNKQDIINSELFINLSDSIKYFQEVLPFGFVGNTILTQINLQNDLFRFKHCFMVHTLEDKILFEILECIHEKRIMSFENFSRRSEKKTTLNGIPIKIQVSTQSGRRYVTIYNYFKHRFFNARLDSIQKVIKGNIAENYDKISNKYESAAKKCWGVSFGEKNAEHLQQIFLKLYINEHSEQYIIERIKREGRGGEFLKIKGNTFLYSIKVHDANEVSGWIKTFTGRILSYESTNQHVCDKFYNDMDKMFQMYLGDD